VNVHALREQHACVHLLPGAKRRRRRVRDATSAGVPAANLVDNSRGTSDGRWHGERVPPQTKVIDLLLHLDKYMLDDRIGMSAAKRRRRRVRDFAAAGVAAAADIVEKGPNTSDGQGEPLRGHGRRRGARDQGAVGLREEG